MTQSRSADAAPSEASAAQRTTGLTLALRNWRVTRQLIVLVAIPAVLILALTGLWVNDTMHSADAYGQVARLAALGQQVNGLAQAMADERSGTAAFIAEGRPAAGLAALRQEYAITDGRAAGVRRLVSQLGGGYPAQTRAGTAQVLASIAALPGLRREAARSQASPLAVITGYSAATSGLFPVIDGIADPGGSSALITGVRALGSLSGMSDQASQQQAILGAALAQGRFEPGALTALTAAQAQQASDLASFRGAATPEESRALTETLALPVAQQAQAVEQQATAAGDGTLALGPRASRQWSAGMSYTVGWMDHAEQQLADWITADAQAQQQSAMRSATVTGGAGAGALALVLLGTVFAARSMVRRLRRLEVAALEGAGAPPVTASAGPAAPAEPFDLADVLWAAASEIEERDRVVLDAQQGIWVSGSAADDTVYLLAELLENATAFSPETTEVFVSGHAVVGGGSLISITDGGTGMSEEQLALLNWELANPSGADMPADGHSGLFGVALLAERHGITVTLSTPPDGGTTAEVYLPDALIWLDAEPGGWPEQAHEAHVAGAGDDDEAGVTAPGPEGAEPDGGLPIFEAIRSGYPHAFGRDPLPSSELPFSEQQAGASPTGQPARPPASPVDGSGRALVWPSVAGRPVPARLPRRTPQPGRVRDGAADQETRRASAAE